MTRRERLYHVWRRWLGMSHRRAYDIDRAHDWDAMLEAGAKAWARFDKARAEPSYWDQYINVCPHCGGALGTSHDKATPQAQRGTAR